MSEPSTTDIRPAEGYAGDISAPAAWAWQQAGRAVLVDVRSRAEYEWVGFVPGALLVPWKEWPEMSPNPGYDGRIQTIAQRLGKPLMLLCRSGVRSIDAALRATELGVVAYNVLGGFEGDRDAREQRGHLNGWRHAGLPWQQN